MQKKPTKAIKNVHEIARKAFNDEFSAFEYSFESSDKILDAMNEGERAMYYQKIKSIVESNEFKQELKEWKRVFYAKLALQSMTDVEFTGYRMVLIAITDFEKRLTLLSQRIQEMSLQTLSDKL